MFLVSISSSTVDEDLKLMTLQLNGLSFAFPASPLLSQPQDEQNTICYYNEVIILLFLFIFFLVQALGVGY